MPSFSRRRFLTASAAMAATPFLSRLFAADKKPDPANPIPAANSAFGCDLYARLRTDRGNVFFSPFSIETALAMTACGAKRNTLAQMQKVLHLPADSDAANAGFKTLLATLNGDGKPADKRGFELSVANALWGMKGFPWRKEFLAVTTANYGAGLVEVNFADEPAARQTINTWVEDRTNKKIKDLIPSGLLDADTRMVLTNAVYFKGTWAEEFDKKLTKDGPFTAADGSKMDVPLMHKTGEMWYAETDDAQAVELGYKGGETAMTVLLPKRADGLAAVEQKLSADTLAAVAKGLRPHKVILTLPRFKAETKYELNAPLKALGMTDAFDGAADFSGMTAADKLYISNVLHKAFVEVNEEGTEA
ncbi:MAG: serpin family protein, partial [Gemmataceae bacterium]